MHFFRFAVLLLYIGEQLTIAISASVSDKASRWRSEKHRTITATKLAEGSIVIDGVFDDLAWKNVAEQRLYTGTLPTVHQEYKGGARANKSDSSKHNGKVQKTIQRRITLTNFSRIAGYTAMMAWDFQKLYLALEVVTTDSNVDGSDGINDSVKMACPNQGALLYTIVLFVVLVLVVCSTLSVSCQFCC
jgi:hypothetical protein